MIDFIVVAYVDSGADSVSRHLAMDEKEAYLSWARELNNHFDFGADFDYVCNETPMKVEGVSQVWEVSFVYGSDSKHCIVKIAC